MSRTTFPAQGSGLAVTNAVWKSMLLVKSFSDESRKMGLAKDS
jgi:hypothetical protein